MLEEKDRAACELGDQLAASLWPKAVQLFLWEDHPHSRPKPVGSGVLVRVENSFFIFSAAHVIGVFKNRVIWAGHGAGNGNLSPLQGAHHFRLTGRIEMGDHQNDSLDAAVALLPPGSPSEFLSAALDASEIDKFSPLREARYLLLGVPANRTGVDQPRKEIRTERKPLIFSEVSDAVYSKMGYEKRSHLLLEWHGKWKTVSGSHGAQSLAGSSGGGIWSFDLSSSTPSTTRQPSWPGKTNFRARY
jgi:hypothetical protein